MTEVKQALNLSTALTPLPETKRGYGIHIYAVTRKPSKTNPGGDKLIYGNGRCVVIRDLADPSKGHTFSEHKGKVNVAAFSPNGEWVASGDDEGKVIVWAVDSGIVKTTVPVGKAILDLTWDGEGKRIVAVGDGAESKAKVFSWDSGNALGSIDYHAKSILSVDYRKVRPFRIVTSGEDMKVNFYEGPPFKYSKSFDKHEKYPNTVRFSPDGAYFLSIGSDMKLNLFDGAKGDHIKEIADAKDGHKGAIYSFAWSPDSKRILTASADKTAKIWDIESGSVVTTFTVAAKPEVLDMQMGALWHGEYLLTVSLSGAINYWDPADPSKPKRIIQGHKENILGLSLDAANKLFYSSDLDGNVVQWNLDDLSQPKWFTGKGHGKSVVAVAVTADGSKLISVGLDDKIRFNDAKECTFSSNAGSLGGKPTGLAAGSKDSSLAAVVLAQQKLVVVRDGEVVSTVDLDFEPLSVALNADDTEITVTGKKNSTVVFSLSGSSPSQVKALEGPDKNVNACKYGPNGMFAAVDSARKISVFDADRQLKTETGWAYHSANVNDVAFSPNGENLATCAMDEAIIVWRNLNAFDPEQRLKTDRTHSLGVTRVDWVDDNTLISTGVDRSIRLWNLN